MLLGSGGARSVEKAMLDFVASSVREMQARHDSAYFRAYCRTYYDVCMYRPSGDSWHILVLFVDIVSFVIRMFIRSVCLTVAEMIVQLLSRGWFHTICIPVYRAFCRKYRPQKKCRNLLSEIISQHFWNIFLAIPQALYQSLYVRLE